MGLIAMSDTSTRLLEQQADEILRADRKRNRYRDGTGLTLSCYRTGEFLQLHRAEWEAGRVVLPGWASYRNVVFTEAWRKHFAGRSLEDPRPILAVACPSCAAPAWEFCTHRHGLKRRSRFHQMRQTAAAAIRL